MGFFDEAFSSLKDMVGDGANEHSDALHEAIQNVESNPEQLAALVGKLSNHPEIGDQVQTWLNNPQAQALMARFRS